MKAVEVVISEAVCRDCQWHSPTEDNGKWKPLTLHNAIQQAKTHARKYKGHRAKARHAWTVQFQDGEQKVSHPPR